MNLEFKSYQEKFLQLKLQSARTNAVLIWITKQVDKMDVKEGI